MFSKNVEKAEWEVWGRTGFFGGRKHRTHKISINIHKLISSYLSISHPKIDEFWII